MTQQFCPHHLDHFMRVPRVGVACGQLPTACSFLSSLCQALALSYLPLKFTTKICSESDADVRELLRCIHDVNMVTRPLIEGTDLYIGTSPCQDFSSAGTGRGHVVILFFHAFPLWKTHREFLPTDRTKGPERTALAQAVRQNCFRKTPGRSLRVLIDEVVAWKPRNH